MSERASERESERKRMLESVGSNELINCGKEAGSGFVGSGTWLQSSRTFSRKLLCSTTLTFAAAAAKNGGWPSLTFKQYGTSKAYVAFRILAAVKPKLTVLCLQLSVGDNTTEEVASRYADHAMGRVSLCRRETSALRLRQSARCRGKQLLELYL